MPTRDDALELATLGWEVLPLRGKVPITRRGLHDATTDPAHIAAWWPAGAQHNIGARVPAGLLVLDFDPQNGGSVEALETALGERLPTTMTVHSGRGTGGQHRYFLHPAGSVTSTRLPEGIDIKTSSGYCVMPPSLHPATGKPYRWEPHEPATLPAALTALMRPPKAIPHRPSPAQHGRPHGRDTRLVEFVRSLAEGRRNSGLYWAACRAVEDNSPPDLLEQLVHAATAAGLPEPEARRTVASAARGHQK